MEEKSPRFYAPKEAVDGLKAVYSVVSPEFAKMTPLLVAKVISLTANRYYPYIPTETFERLKDLPDRVIVTDEAQFDELGKKLNEEDTTDLDGFFTYKGTLIVMKNPESMEYVWEKMTPDLKETWAKTLGGEENARKRVGEDRFAKVLIHETFHGFHPEGGHLLNVFIEAGVNYYAREIAQSLSLPEFSLSDDMFAKLYEFFLRLHGESAHETFYGLSIEPDRTKALMEHFKQDASALFDSMRGKKGESS